MKVRFLLDENLSPRLKTAALRISPMIDVLRVGDEGAPTLETQDSDILRYVERAQRLLITKNRASMPTHVAAHLASGWHHWGVFRVRPMVTIGQLADEIRLIWEASEAEEWIDQMLWLPF
ncbi:hypothetical protein FJZ31_13465 [Candidatus Poribacteria bacterium]|nr:hypothetical protein [Candidatus Poribacteria bacterium]